MRRKHVLKQIYQLLMKSSCDPHPPPIVVVIDALDKCGRPEDIRLLLQMRREVQDLCTVQPEVLPNGMLSSVLHLVEKAASFLKLP